jgi:energy-coupling factor transporter ATP-binding protein EcfA2
MVIIGITGSIRHGKTTLAKCINVLYPNNSAQLSSFEIIAQVADDLNLSTQAIPGLSVNELNKWLKILPSVLKERLDLEINFSDIRIKSKNIHSYPNDYKKLFLYVELININKSVLDSKITEQNRDQYRPILQWLGGYLVKTVDSGIWFNQIIKRANTLSHSIAVCSVDGIRYPSDAQIIKDNGGVVVEVVRPGVKISDANDMTEKERTKIISDLTIINDSGLVEFKECVKQLVDDVLSGRPKRTYISSKIS